MSHYLKANPDTNGLPVIIPLLLYTGKRSPYPYSLELVDCFADKALARANLYEPAQLIDLSQIPDDEIKQHGQVALLEMVQKHIHARDLMNFAHDFVSLLNQIKITRNLYIPLLEYIIVACDSKKHNAFFKVLTEQQAIEYR